MAGHSKWAQIKYRKALTDAKRSKMFSKLSAQITLAARKGGDSLTNIALREAIARARELNIPQENIERAIHRGTGALPGTALEGLVLEAYGPGGVALLIVALSDNRNRTLHEIRELLQTHGGKLAKAGSVRWLFQEAERVSVPKERWADDLELLAIDEGAKDIRDEDGYRAVYIKKDGFERLREEFSRRGVPFESRLEFLAKNEVSIGDRELQSVLEALFEALEDEEAVEKIYSNAKFT